MGSFGAIVFEIPPVEMMVVNEASIEKQSAVRLQDAGEGVCGISGSASVGGGCGAASESVFTTKPKSGISL